MAGIVNEALWCDLLLHAFGCALTCLVTGCYLVSQSVSQSVSPLWTTFIIQSVSLISPGLLLKSMALVPHIFSSVHPSPFLTNWVIGDGGWGMILHSAEIFVQSFLQANVTNPISHRSILSDCVLCLRNNVSKSGCPCPCQTCSEWPPTEKTGRGRLLNHPTWPSDDPLSQGTELNQSCYKAPCTVCL